MSGPYITTVLTATVNLKPRQMDNNIYKHLKQNLIDKIEGHCYRGYGYVSKIYEILEYTKGRIVPENPTAGALFGVKFSCKLCHPLKNRPIICKVQKITKLFLNATNGPITVIITMNKFNKQIFFQDSKTNKLYIKSTNPDVPPTEIKPGSFIKVTIESKSFNDMDSIIKAMGELNDVATESDIAKNFEEEYDKSFSKLTNFDKYITGEKEEDIEIQTEQVIKDAKDMTNVLDKTPSASTTSISMTPDETPDQPEEKN